MSGHRATHEWHLELTLTVRETEVSITLKLVEVIAHKNDYAALEWVLDDHGIVTFALVHDLVKAHSEGDVTVRQIASLTDLSPGTTYDLVDALYSILDLGDGESPPTTYTPDGSEDEAGDLLEEFADE